MIDAVLIVFDRAPFRGEEINYFGTGRSDSTVIASVGVKICERGDKYLEMEVDMQSGDAMQFPSNIFVQYFDRDTNISDINYFGGATYWKYYVRGIKLKFLTNKSF